MRPMLLPGLLCLLVSTAPTARAAEAIAVERYSLPNGLDVVLHDDDRYPLVAVRVVYHVGSAHDPRGKEGTTHLLEHAMFDGTVHVAAGEHRARLLRAGASGINASTSDSLTSYFETVPVSRLALALWLESDRMGFFNPRIRRLAIDRQRRIVTQELAQRRRGDANATQFLALRTVLAPEGHPDHDQDAASVARITLDDIDAISRRYYGPANATLILAGALPPDTKDLVERYFGDLAGGERPPAATPPPAMTIGRHATVGAVAGTNPVVLVGWPTPALYTPGDADADVLARVLESRTRGRSNTPAIIALDAHQESSMHGSYFMVRVEGTRGSTPQGLLDELDALLAGIAKGELEEIAVRVAAKRQILALRRRLGSLQGRADAMASYIGAGKSADSLAGDAERYRRTTRATVARFVASSLIGRPRGVVFVSPRVEASTEAP